MRWKPKVSFSVAWSVGWWIHNVIQKLSAHCIARQLWRWHRTVGKEFATTGWRTWEWRCGLSHYSGLRLLAFQASDIVTLAVKGVAGHKGQLFNDCRLLLWACTTTNWWPESINSTIIGEDPLLPCSLVVIGGRFFLFGPSDEQGQGGSAVSLSWLEFALHQSYQFLWLS